MKSKGILLGLIIAFFIFSGLALLGLSIFGFLYLNILTLDGEVNFWFNLIAALICLILSFLDLAAAFLLFKRKKWGIVFGLIASWLGIPTQSTLIAFVVAILISYFFDLRLETLAIPCIVLVIIFGAIFIRLLFHCFYRKWKFF